MQENSETGAKVLAVIIAVLAVVGLLVIIANGLSRLGVCG